MSVAAAPAVRAVEEVRADLDVPLWVHPGWRDEFQWLVQGTTGRGREDEPFDLGLSGKQEVGKVLDRWRRLLRATGVPAAAHARQVHGAEIWHHMQRGAPGVLVMDGYDGHVTDRAGLLLAVGVADCVPVTIVDPASRRVAMVHSGWRGTAAGIGERAIALLASLGGSADELRLHCGPAICGCCYEVGPEVHAAIHPDRPPPPARTPIDVRAAIAERALAAGLRPEHVSVSTHCTRCGPPDFFSHRGGSVSRQMGVVAVRE